MSAMWRRTAWVGCDGLRFLMRQRTDRVPLFVRLGRRNGFLCGRRGGFLLMEAQCTELVGDKLQASELEGLRRRERWRHPQSVAGDRRELQGAEVDRLATGAVNGVIETIHSPKQ